MQYVLQKKWSYLSWAGAASVLAGALFLSAGEGTDGGLGPLIAAAVLSVAGLALMLTGMFKLRCPACGRLLGREATSLFGDEIIFCARCGARINLE